jgi:death-on-curing protein
MRYLTLGEVVTLHRAVVAATGGADGIRDLSGLESALAQPKATFDGVDLYPTVIDKAATLAFSLALNHPFVDGMTIEASTDEQEQLMLNLAGGNLSRDTLTTWLAEHVVGPL